MTEDQWLRCIEPMPMVGLVRGKTTDRKLRLLSVASCRRAWELFEDERSRGGVEAAERYADGGADASALGAAAAAARQAHHDTTARRGRFSAFYPECMLTEAAQCVAQPPADGGARYDGWRAMSTVSQAVALIRPRSLIKALTLPEGDLDFEPARPDLANHSLDEQMAQAALIRDVIGNPFRPIAMHPSWLTANVVGLARVIYDERAFERLPILADALMDAGCTDEDVLGHCRSAGPHVRGCWVVDLLLGKG